MSNRSFRQVLIVAFALTLSGFAFARNPPALVAQQQAAANGLHSDGGYRDINFRFGVAAPHTSQVMLQSGGYRDINLRFSGKAAHGSQTASVSPASRWR
jgi:hypothetical protein